jgi:hypothetical protein
MKSGALIEECQLAGGVRPGDFSTHVVEDVNEKILSARTRKDSASISNILRRSVRV